MVDTVTVLDGADFSKRQFGEPLGVSERTVEHWVDKDLIRHYRVGRQVRIPREELARVRREGVPLPEKKSA
jgi:excisionase family DNA binding protein